VNPVYDFGGQVALVTGAGSKPIGRLGRGEEIAAAVLSRRTGPLMCRVTGCYPEHAPNVRRMPFLGHVPQNPHRVEVRAARGGRFETCSAP
jgi:hypothetical protein